MDFPVPGGPIKRLVYQIRLFMSTDFFCGENGCNDKFSTLKIPVAFDAGWRKNPQCSLVSAPLP